MRYANTNSYCYTYLYADPNTNSHCYTDPHTDYHPYSHSAAADTNSDTTSPDTYADSASADTNSYGDTYGNGDIDPYANTDTDTGYSLSTVSDDRPYQGSQHPVQFHGISKRH